MRISLSWGFFFCSSSASASISSALLDNVVTFSFRNLSGCSLDSISEDSFRNLKLLKKL